MSDDDEVQNRYGSGFEEMISPKMEAIFQMFEPNEDGKIDMAVLRRIFK